MLQPVAQPVQTRRRGLELPGAHREAEVLRGQRADRADVDGVERVGVVELLARRGGQDLAVAAVGDTRAGAAPATSSQTRMQRVHRMQRSCVEHDVSARGRRPWPCGPWARRRASRALSYSKYSFCSVHSPALSQIGQSTGWLTQRELEHLLARERRLRVGRCGPPCRRRQVVLAARLRASGCPRPSTRHWRHMRRRPAGPGGSRSS